MVVRISAKLKVKYSKIKAFHRKWIPLRAAGYCNLSQVPCYGADLPVSVSCICIFSLPYGTVTGAEALKSDTWLNVGIIHSKWVSLLKQKCSHLIIYKVELIIIIRRRRRRKRLQKIFEGQIRSDVCLICWGLVNVNFSPRLSLIILSVSYPLPFPNLLFFIGLLLPYTHPKMHVWINEWLDKELTNNWVIRIVFCIFALAFYFYLEAFSCFDLLTSLYYF